MIFPSICLVTAFVMSTWFVENLAVARTCGSVVHGGVARRHYCGCTVSVGAPRRSRELLRRRCTHCRHCCGPRCCSTSCDSTTRSIPTHLSPGCAQATTRGVPVTVGGQLVDSFGAKVLCSRQPVSDTALANALCTSRWSQRARTYSLLTNKRRSASRMLFSNLVFELRTLRACHL